MPNKTNIIGTVPVFECGQVAIITATLEKEEVVFQLTSDILEDSVTQSITLSDINKVSVSRIITSMRKFFINRASTRNGRLAEAKEVLKEAGFHCS